MPGIIGWGETISLIANVPAVFTDIVAPLGDRLSGRRTSSACTGMCSAPGFYHHKRAAVMAICSAWKWPCGMRWANRPSCRFTRSVGRALAARTSKPPPIFSPTIPKRLNERLGSAFLDTGYETFKVKIGFDEPSDIVLAETAREVIGDTSRCGSTSTAPGRVATAKRQLEKLRAIRSRLCRAAARTRRSRRARGSWSPADPVPIALDESAYTLSDVGNIVRAAAADVVLLDPHEAGGLWQTIKAAAICEAVGIPVTAAFRRRTGAVAVSLYPPGGLDTQHVASPSTPSAPISAATSRPIHPSCRTAVIQVPQDQALASRSTRKPCGEKYRVDGIVGAYLDSERRDWFPVKPAY